MLAGGSWSDRPGPDGEGEREDRWRAESAGADGGAWWSSAEQRERGQPSLSLPPPRPSCRSLSRNSLLSVEEAVRVHPDPGPRPPADWALAPAGHARGGWVQGPLVQSAAARASQGEQGPARARARLLRWAGARLDSTGLNRVELGRTGPSGDPGIALVTPPAALCRDLLPVFPSPAGCRLTSRRPRADTMSRWLPCWLRASRLGTARRKTVCASGGPVAFN